MAESFGRLEILGAVGFGGMAEILRVRDPQQPDAALVLKRLRDDGSADPERVRMLEHEAELLARLDHPNVVSASEVVEHEGETGLLMPYVDGVDLERLRREAYPQPWPLELAVHVVQGLLAGLDHAHDARDADGALLHLVHRDVSPANVMIGLDGRVVLVDFGVAASRTSPELGSSVRGKARYLAPEQARSESVGPTTDLYAVALVLYELLVGERPFEGLASGAMVLKAAQGEAPSLADKRPDLPEALLEAYRRATSPDPSDRPASARALSEAIDASVEAMPTDAIVERLGRWATRARRCIAERQLARAWAHARALTNLEDALDSALE